MCFRKISMLIKAAITEICIFRYSSVTNKDNGTIRVFITYICFETCFTVSPLQQLNWTTVIILLK